MMTYELYHAGVKGMKWGKTRNPKTYTPVGEPAKGEQDQRNRPRGRQKNVTGKAKPVYKRESVSSHQNTVMNPRRESTSNYTNSQWNNKVNEYQKSWDRISSRPGTMPTAYDNADPTTINAAFTNDVYKERAAEWRKKYTDYYKRGPQGPFVGPTKDPSDTTNVHVYSGGLSVHTHYDPPKKESWIDKGKKLVQKLFDKLFGKR